jgi:2-amino-4-hydroxy-6-hydroxymethyldihydropteridine diphosphokinase
MNTAIIMLGSNSNPDQNIEIAKEKLSEFFDLVKQSSRIITKPVGNNYKFDFHNESLKLLSVDTAEETKILFKQIENDLGRTYESKLLGIIPIDIDLIYWNDTLVNEDYNRFSFVKKCVDEIKQ